jgi:hypothetical protein
MESISKEPQHSKWSQESSTSVHYPYVYSHLPDNDSVRLLHLRSDSSSPHGWSIVTSIASLALPPVFYSLSYTWDEPEFPEDVYSEPEDPAWLEPPIWITINVDGCAFEVRANLFDFLCRHSKTQEQKPLWIDAVSINQADAAERSMQVAKMGAIYQAAAKVLVWLGSREPEPDVIWTITTFIPAYQAKTCDLGDRERSLMDLFAFDSEHELSRIIGSEIWVRWKTAWLPFFKFFLRKRWWTRGWVVQEVVLKGRAQVDILCGPGSSTFAWILPSKFFFVILTGSSGSRSSLRRCLQSNLHGWEAGKGTLSRLVSQAHISTELGIDSFRERAKEFGADTPIKAWYCYMFEIIKRMKPCRFTDKRDHIYGCLGLVVGHLPQGMTNPIQPNYTKSHQEIFTEVASLFLINMPRLEGLSLCSGLRNKELPSWVPDFSAHIDSQEPKLWSTFPGSGRVFDAWEASKSRTQLIQPRFSSNGSLVLQGAKFDVVRDFSNVRNSSSRSHLWMLRFCTIGDIYDPSNESRAKALCQSLTTYKRLNLESESELAFLFRHWFTFYTAHNYNVFSKKGKSRLFRLNEVLSRLDTLSNSHPNKDWFPTATEFKSIIKSDIDFIAKKRAGLFPSPTQARLFFTTASGNLGHGPEKSMPGDEIWLVQGARVPFVLRKQTSISGYRIVGDAYVHGFMHGEMMTEELLNQIAPVEIW